MLTPAKPGQCQPECGHWLVEPKKRTLSLTLCPNGWFSVPNSIMACLIPGPDISQTRTPMQALRWDSFQSSCFQGVLWFKGYSCTQLADFSLWGQVFCSFNQINVFLRNLCKREGWWGQGGRVGEFQGDLPFFGNWIWQRSEQGRCHRPKRTEWHFLWL